MRSARDAWDHIHHGFTASQYPILILRLLTFILDRTGQNRASESPLWATRGKLWTKQPGLSRERWDFWSSRFKEISRSDNVADATAKDADTAVRAMIEVEKNAGSRT